jgi:hypothetical protein
MRDIHFDGEFLRDFDRASRTWSWATWHQQAAADDAVARRLLEQVFGTEPSQPDRAVEPDPRDIE